MPFTALKHLWKTSVGMLLAVHRSTDTDMGHPGLNTKGACRRTIHPPRSGCIFLFPAYTYKNSHVFRSILIMNNVRCSWFVWYCCLELPLCYMHVCTHTGLLYFLVVHQLTGVGAAVAWRSVSFQRTVHWCTHCSAPCSCCRVHFKVPFLIFKALHICFCLQWQMICPSCGKKNKMKKK